MGLAKLFFKLYKSCFYVKKLKLLCNRKIYKYNECCENDYTATFCSDVFMMLTSQLNAAFGNYFVFLEIDKKKDF